MGFERILARLLEYGVLAPSVYNSQPWRFSLNPQRGELEIIGDEDRARRVALDPQRRDLFTALGACLEHMVLAASALGYEVEENLFPDSSRPQLAARLVLKVLPETMPETLFSTLLTRQTHAGKYRKDSVQDIHLDRLKNCRPFSSAEKIYFITEEGSLQKLTEFLHDLSHEGSGHPDLVEEGTRWITPRRETAEGLPMGHIGLPLSVRIRFGLLRYFGYAREMREVSRQSLLRQGHGIEAPGFLLMTTLDPHPQGYLRCGRWFAHLALTLSELELGSQALHLPLVLAAGRTGLGKLFNTGEGEEPTLLLRFGQPESKAWPRTFRRPVEKCVLEPYLL